MKRIVQFSGGLASYFAAKRIVQRHGAGDVILLFADTLIESDDLYRIMPTYVADVGATFERIADGRTPFDVFKDVRFIGNTQVDPCSAVLKRNLCRKWLEDRFTPFEDALPGIVEQAILYVGITWDEGREDEIRERWKPWRVEFPLCDKPYITKADMIRETLANGLEVSRAYTQGFPHDNCGGGCVKAGISQWVHLRKVRPAVFQVWKEGEAGAISEIGKDVAILRDRRGGTTKPMTLEELEIRILANDPTLPKYDWGGCGCGV
jgi:hypothetical protein